MAKGSPLDALGFGVDRAFDFWESGKDRKLTEEESKKQRRLTRDEMLLELLMLASETDFENRVRERDAQFDAPILAKSAERSAGPSPLTEARNAAVGRQLESDPAADPGLKNLVASNFEEFRAMKARGQQAGAAITPESLMVRKEDPMDTLTRTSPGLWQQLQGQGRGGFEKGENVTTQEAASLNAGRGTMTPEELRRMLDEYTRNGR